MTIPPGGTLSKDMALKGADFMQFFRRSDFFVVSFQKNGGKKYMYGIYTYIWLIYMVNVGKYTIHGYYGWWKKNMKSVLVLVFLVGSPNFEGVDFSGDVIYIFP